MHASLADASLADASLADASLADASLADASLADASLVHQIGFLVWLGSLTIYLARMSACHNSPLIIFGLIVGAC